ncbi:hypothetical protein K505DRAFT_255323 [Melanomma pulvis-pyrius CBS 109.77]|uniref:Carboxymuconolactone decarboxylase-like domain-containing protein n=1 Tax=Melanomma pulvis-pyrius CBS 109.77 TaxID=1314802 RepID=A0A6A6WXA2_9PLEO|nr:hypothetical protein K505DRAFT_255323 [Melanomma pulvis-pyrius CBS 109.77]
MSERFPAKEADPALVRQLEEQIHKVHGESLPFEWRSGEDTLFGPYPTLLHSPTIMPAFWAMARASISPNSVKPRNRELAILGLLSVIQARYILYAHRLISLKLGFTAEQYSIGLTGVTPSDLSEEEGMAYQLGRTLADLKGPLSNDLWEKAIQKMEKKEVLGVVHAVGGYAYIALLTNVNGEDERFH